jgi:uncharacterized membrane-anchored protein
MREDGFIYAGFALVAGWSALVRVQDNVFLTVVLRLAVTTAVLAAIFMVLPGANAQSLAIMGALFLMFMALPILFGSYLFAVLRQAVGTGVYVGALVLASIAFATSFAMYLRS